ncbi:reverse transcriptase [Plakobranchus ocellatus]|uniref:Reverse transcriptase n=1 Tax=Plakobranchus ocellatus TaxID=259542 RepID=A0AAV3Y073_9GAST|nr:reverse transcriptase [Plakobranchus ocellatus]
MNCPEKKKSDGNLYRKTVAAMTTTPSEPCKGPTCPTELKCGCRLPTMSAACIGHSQKTNGDMPVARRRLNGQSVRVLRDSGSSCVVIKKGLAEGSTVAPDKLLVYLANGETESATTTKVYLECPYYVGEVTAIKMENPLYKVIVGNIVGA